MNDLSDGFDFLHAPYKRPTYITRIPEYSPTFEELSKQMRINADIIMKEISDHVDSELERFKTGMKPPKHGA